MTNTVDDLARSLAGMDAARRAGWRAAYQTRDDLERAKQTLFMAVDGMLNLYAEADGKVESLGPWFGQRTGPIFHADANGDIPRLLAIVQIMSAWGVGRPERCPWTQNGEWPS
jgi:hypothetical protein